MGEVKNLKGVTDAFDDRAGPSRRDVNPGEKVGAGRVLPPILEFRDIIGHEIVIGLLPGSVTYMVT
jgi:hypothetical protein